MTSRLERLDKGERELIREEPQPDWTTPMLATLTHEHFSDPAWLFERKLDGERALIFKEGASVRLFTRNQKSIDDTYPELVEALATQPAECFVADGEIVAFEGDVTTFARLQQRLQIEGPDEARASGVAVYLYLFDLMHLDGYALDALPLRRRKTLLRDALDFAEPIRFTAPKGSREGFGSLLVGYYADGELCYAGKVGTGFDDALLCELRERMEGIERQSSPFADEVREREVTWMTPELVGEFGFTEWTRSGKLRHPRFLGLRRDKAAKEVGREWPEDES